MKKAIAVIILGLLLVGCAPTTYETKTVEEFDSIARTKGWDYTARSQPVSWITAEGLVEHGNKMPGQGAGHTQQRANELALEVCSTVATGCIIIRESGRITDEAKSIIASLKKKKEKRITEEKKIAAARKKAQKEAEEANKKEVTWEAYAKMFSLNGPDDGGYTYSKKSI